MYITLITDPIPLAVPPAWADVQGFPLTLVTPPITIPDLIRMRRIAFRGDAAFFLSIALAHFGGATTMMSSVALQAGDVWVQPLDADGVKLFAGNLPLLPLHVYVAAMSGTPSLSLTMIIESGGQT